MTIRDELVKEVREYLVGPRGEDEILPRIPNFPLDYYISGVLLPKNTELESQDTESLDTDRGNDNETESFSDQARGMFKQNSIGLRVDLNPQVDTVLIEIDYGKYRLNTESRNWKRERLLKDDREFKINLNKKGDKIEILNPDDGVLDSTITWNVDEGKSSDSKVPPIFQSKLTFTVSYPEIFRVLLRFSKASHLSAWQSLLLSQSLPTAIQLSKLAQSSLKMVVGSRANTTTPPKSSINSA